MHIVDSISGKYIIQIILLQSQDHNIYSANLILQKSYLLASFCLSAATSLFSVTLCFFH